MRGPNAKEEMREGAGGCGDPDRPDARGQRRDIVWRNVVLMSLLHLGAVYALLLIPKAQPLTLLWGKSPHPDRGAPRPRALHPRGLRGLRLQGTRKVGAQGSPTRGGRSRDPAPGDTAGVEAPLRVPGLPASWGAEFRTGKGMEGWSELYLGGRAPSEAGRWVTCSSLHKAPASRTPVLLRGPRSFWASQTPPSQSPAGL